LLFSSCGKKVSEDLIEKSYPDTLEIKTVENYDAPLARVKMSDDRVFYFMGDNKNGNRYISLEMLNKIENIKSESQQRLRLQDISSKFK
jgi:hypothetical protein